MTESDEKPEAVVLVMYNNEVDSACNFLAMVGKVYRNIIAFDLLEVRYYISIIVTFLYLYSAFVGASGLCVLLSLSVPSHTTLSIMPCIAGLCEAKSSLN